jgi:protein CpxP
MKHIRHHLIAAGLLAALGLSAVAQTAAPAPGANAPTANREGRGPGDPAKAQEGHARMQERMNQGLAEFKQKLQLTPGQEAAWGTYTAALKPAQLNRPDRAEFAKLSTPERIDRMRAARATRMAEMDRRGDATKTFYAGLTAEQKKVFDAEPLQRGPHGGEGHHGHGSHQRG